MNGIKIFFAWALTVIIGSIIPSLFMAVTGNFLYCIGFAVIMLAFSSLSSLPTLLVLILVHETNKAKDMKIRMKRVTVAHVIMFVLTIVAGNVYTDDGFWSAFTLVVFYYAIVGLLVWVFMFMKSWSRETQHQKMESAQAD